MSWQKPHPSNADRAIEFSKGEHPPEVVVAMAIADRLAGIEEALVAQTLEGGLGQPALEALARRVEAEASTPISRKAP